MNPFARYICNLWYHSLGDMHRLVRLPMNPMAKRIARRHCYESLCERVVMRLVNPRMRRIARRDPLGNPWRNTLFCGLSCESLRESHRSARVVANPLAKLVVLRFVQRSERNISLGKIGMIPLARCIVLKFVVSIPKRHASLGETCYESLGKTPCSANFVMNIYAETAFLQFVTPKMQRITRRELLRILWRNVPF